MADVTLQSEIMRLLGSNGVDKRLGKGRHYFPEAVRQQFERQGKTAPSNHEITQVLWGLVSRGLIFIDFSQSAPENWEWRLTDAGQRSATDENYNPDDPERYLKRFRSAASNLGPTVEMYLAEALRCYVSGAYLASAVMLGVASEATFLDVAPTAATWLGTYGQKLSDAIANNKVPFVQKFDAFRLALEPHKRLLPPEVGDALSLTFHSVLDAFRVTRNDSGHPTGRTLSREDQYIAIQMAGRYLQRFAQLKHFFEDTSSPRP